MLRLANTPLVSSSTPCGCTVVMTPVVGPVGGCGGGAVVVVVVGGRP